MKATIPAFSGYNLFFVFCYQRRVNNVEALRRCLEVLIEADAVSTTVLVVCVFWGGWVGGCCPRGVRVDLCQ